jgi:hypothetical protein
MKVRSSLMIYDHGMPSGNVSVLHNCQPDMAHAMRIGSDRLTMKKHGDAVFAEAAVGVSRDQVTAVATKDFSDAPSPTTAVTDAGALLAEDAVVSHFSLSTLEGGAAGEIATD